MQSGELGEVPLGNVRSPAQEKLRHIDVAVPGSDLQRGLFEGAAHIVDYALRAVLEQKAHNLKLTANDSAMQHGETGIAETGFHRLPIREFGALREDSFNFGLIPPPDYFK